MKRKSIIVLLLMSLVFSGYGQFYNGLQMDFGKNRLQYRDFVWQYYRFDKFDVYFYERGRPLARLASNIIEQKIAELESFFQYELQSRVIILVFNKLTDLRTSNIGFVGASDQYNIGGKVLISGNKISVYYDGSTAHFRDLINKAVSEIYLNEMLSGVSFKERLMLSALSTYPEWYFKGLISYLSVEWNSDIDNAVRDGVLSGKYHNFNTLSGNDAIYAGHSFWQFIATRYDKNTIPNIIYLTRVAKGINSGFVYVLGTSLQALFMEWKDYYYTLYQKNEKKRFLPQDTVLPIKIRKRRLYKNILVNPVSPDTIAYYTNKMGRVKIYIENIKTKKRKCIFRRGHRLDQIIDKSYPLLQWHPTGKYLTFFDEKLGQLYFNLYDVEGGKIEKRPIFHIQHLLSYHYSKDGFSLITSVQNNGKTDIAIYQIVGNSFTYITNDLANDIRPQYVDNDTKVVFSSNRNTDQINADNDTLFSKTYDLYIYDLKTKKLTRLTNTPDANEYDAHSLGTNKYLFLSDASGIVNLQKAQYDSTISVIDTAVHYRYFTTLHPVSNFSRNILEYHFDETSNNLNLLFYYNHNYLPILSNLSAVTTTDTPALAFYKEYQQLKKKEIPIKKEDSSIFLPKQTTNNKYVSDTVDTTQIDINNYIFTKTALDFQGNEIYLSDTLKSANQTDKNTRFKKHQHLYFTSFYNNYVVNQIDFGFLNQSYQAFTGGAVYFNPGFNFLFKIGTRDLFEDYRVTGGFRFSGNFNSNEYLLSFENLKKRADKQFLFYRQVITNPSDDNYLIKTQSNHLVYVWRYPFSQVDAVKISSTLRYDKDATLSLNRNALNQPTVAHFWSGLKTEYIFDNTLSLGINLYQGLRLKIFAEGYIQPDKKKSDIGIVGFDVRHYLKIHRNLIFASRLAGSTSFGHSLLIYYLGSEDNWINLSGKPTFDHTIPIDYSKNYVFQTLATNMRGFTQNIRNGNSFLVANNEIRWPIIKYFSQQPLNSEFFETFQLISFFDIGSAWSGKTPMSEENKYNSDVYVNGPIKVIINNDMSPFVMGYGVGMRAKLLGYFVRADWAWGIDSGVQLPKIFYLSLSLDF